MHRDREVRRRLTALSAISLLAIIGAVLAVVVMGTDMVHAAAALLLLFTVGGVLGTMVLPGRGCSER